MNNTINLILLYFTNPNLKDQRKKVLLLKLDKIGEENNKGIIEILQFVLSGIK